MEASLALHTKTKPGLSSSPLCHASLSQSDDHGSAASSSWEENWRRLLPPEPQIEQNMQLEPLHTVKWSLLELMSVLSVHTLKGSLTRACSSSNENKSSHNPISCPLVPLAGREAETEQRSPNKDLAQTSGPELSKLDWNPSLLLVCQLLFSVF